MLSFKKIYTSGTQKLCLKNIKISILHIHYPFDSNMYFLQYEIKEYPCVYEEKNIHVILFFLKQTSLYLKKL